MRVRAERGTPVGRGCVRAPAGARECCVCAPVRRLEFNAHKIRPATLCTDQNIRTVTRHMPMSRRSLQKAAFGPSARNERGCERLEHAKKTPEGLTDAGGRRAGTGVPEHALGNACDTMGGHGLRICAHHRESCCGRPATEVEDQVARRLVRVERLSQAPAQAVQVRQWGSASRKQRALRLHRWSWQTDRRTCWALASSTEIGSAHSGVVADITVGPSEPQTPEEDDPGCRQRHDNRRQCPSAKPLPCCGVIYHRVMWVRR